MNWNELSPQIKQHNTRQYRNLLSNTNRTNFSILDSFDIKLTDDELDGFYKAVKLTICKNDSKLFLFYSIERNDVDGLAISTIQLKEFEL